MFREFLISKKVDLIIYAVAWPCFICVHLFLPRDWSVEALDRIILVCAYLAPIFFIFEFVFFYFNWKGRK